MILFLHFKMLKVLCEENTNLIQGVYINISFYFFIWLLKEILEMMGVMEESILSFALKDQ